MYNDYASRLPTAPTDLEGYVGTGSAGSIASGRIAYTYGLHGPAITIDTACSSSLVAIHLAAQALHNNECDLALAGGVTIMATPQTFIEFSRQHGLAPDGRCKSFSTHADGAAWSEGVGLILLERLSDAHHNNHPILALIRGSAINQDGASNGLTAPNGPAQEKVIRQALANAQLSTTDIDAVEAHGTGTTLGDPIEAQALLATYGQHRPADQPLWLGSIKSNIGHTQAAAGVASVIKMVMAMHHATLPQTLHADQPTPHVDWTTGSVNLLTQQQDWTNTHHPRRAAVSSFGLSGTNAHLILEQPEQATDERAPVAARPMPWLLSAKSEAALRSRAEQLLSYLDANEDVDAADVGHALATGTNSHQHRAVVIAEHVDKFRGGLADVAAGRPGSGVVRGKPASGGLAIMFSGQGSQHPQMGHQLTTTNPTYHHHLHHTLNHINPHLPQPLTTILTAPPHTPHATLLNHTHYTQPALFTLHTTLYHLTHHHGITPTHLTGHSIGEIAAAHLAGTLSLHDATTLITTRAHLMAQLPPTGTMIAINTTETEAQAAIHGHEHHIAIAAINGPNSIVLSGDTTTLHHIAHQFRTQGHRTHQLPVSHAFHSPLMNPILTQFHHIASTLTYHQPHTPIISTLTGTLVTDEITNPDYWVDHITQPVRFHDAIQQLTQLGTTTFLEIGPDATLSTMAQECVDPDLDPAPTFISILRRDMSEPEAVVTALAQVHAAGGHVDWQDTFGPEPRGVTLPTYPFQRQRYWLDMPAGAGDTAGLGLTDVDHPLLGAAVELADDQGLVFTGQLSPRNQSWLADHTVADTILLPGTALLELTLHTAHHTTHTHLTELTLHTPITLHPTTNTQLQIHLTPPHPTTTHPTATHRTITIHTRPQPTPTNPPQPWTHHATGQLSQTPSATPRPRTGQWPPRDAIPVAVEELYDRLADLGLDYGPAFRGVTAAWRHGDDVHAEVLLPDTVDSSGFGVHPALLDAALHPVALLGDSSDDAEVRLPFAWEDVTLHATGARAVRVTVSPNGADRCAVHLTDDEGNPVVTVGSLTLRQVALAQLKAAGGGRSLYRVDWVAAPRATGTAIVGQASLVGDDLLYQPAEYVVLRCQGTGAQPLAETHDLTGRMLTAVRAWLADDGAAESTLVVVTRAAVATRPDEPVTDLAGAAVWGLLRVAQTEQPSRFVLLDVDTDDVSDTAIGSAVATGEPQLALRAGMLTVPRLAHVPPSVPDGGPRLDPDGTVLVTGGTGALGALTAGHLVAHHGVGHVLLASRSGGAAVGAAAVIDELTALGADVSVVACDVADRAGVERLLATIAPEHPLTAVVHTAGVLHDAPVTALRTEDVTEVLRAKADGAWHLHELTKDLDLAAFVLFSSAAGTLGNPGQANYAAANTFLDALAHHRRSLGLPAHSLAWGLWDQAGGMTGQADPARIGRTGVRALAGEDALALLDTALARSEPVLVPIGLDLTALRAAARAGVLPAVLSGLVPGGATRQVATDQAGADALVRRLAGAPEAEQDVILLDLVRGCVATVLGHDGPDAVDPEQAFKDLGFDSLTAVELRNRLIAATGLRLPATLVFDHPTVTSLAGRLRVELAPKEDTSPTESRVRELLTGIPFTRLRDAGLLDALLKLADVDGEPMAEQERPAIADSIDELAADELISLALNDIQD